MKKAKRDALSMLVLMVFSAAFYFYFIPAQVPVVGNAKTFFTSRTFPRVSMAAIFIVAAIGLYNAIFQMVKLSKGAPEERTSITAAQWWKALSPYAAFLIILAYTLGLKYFGYILSTVVFVPAFLLMLRCKKWQYYVGGYGFCVIMYLVFTLILNVRLP